MRILQVGKFYHPAHGGIETVLRTLAEGLASQGDEVTVLCSAHPGWDGVPDPEERVAGVRVLRARRYATLFSQPIAPGLPRDLARLARGFDVVNVHTPNPLAEAAAIAVPGRIPLVVSHHSDVVRQRALLPFYRPLLKLFLRRADRVVVATRNHVTTSAFLPKFVGKCQVVPYGIDPAPLALTPPVAARAEALRRELGPFALFVGRLVPYKGVAYLIRALQGVPGARLAIVGDGPARAELEREARELGLGDRARFAGGVDDSVEMAAYYHACEVFALPSVSRNEAFGVVQLEAMACGKPTVATRLDSGVTLVGEEGVTGLLVPPEDPAALAAAIQGLLSDDRRRLEMGAAASKRFEERFTRERMVAGYRELYARLIETKRG